MLDFLELPWHDAVLQPQAHAQTKGFISTPSYSQVVEPVNGRAVGRWRRYQTHFDGIMQTLQPLLARWSYDGVASSNSR